MGVRSVPTDQQGNAKNIEEFSDLLDVAMINLQEAHHHYELGGGSLYTVATQNTGSVVSMISSLDV